MSKLYYKILKTYTFLLLLCAFGTQDATAQNQQLVDSLTRVLEDSPKDTNRIDILLNLWKAVVYSNPQQSRVYAEEMLKFASEIEYTRGLATGHQRLGVSYSYLSQEEKARKEYLKALEIYKSPEGWSEKLQAIMLFNIGLGFKDNGEYDSTLYYLSEASKVFERVGTPTQRGAVFDGKSGVYIEQGKYQLGIENALLAVEAFEEAKDSLRLPDALFKIGMASVEIKNYPEALKYYRQSLSMYQENADTYYEINVLSKIAAVYSELNERDSSLYYYEVGTKRARTFNDPDLICNLLIGFSGLYLDIKDYKKAEPLLKESLKLSEE